MSQDILEALTHIARARGVKYDYVIESLKEAIKTGARKRFGKDLEVEVSINKSTGEIRINIMKKVVEEVENPDLEVSLVEAQLAKASLKVGDEFRIPIGLEDLGRGIIDTIKQSLVHKVREAEKDRLLDEFQKKIGEIVKGTIKVVSRNEIIVDLGVTEGVIPGYGAIKSEYYRLDAPIKAIVLKVEKSNFGPRIILSRTDPAFLIKLLFIEIPEIRDGTIEVVKVVREPGVRAKVGVQSKDASIDPVGACIGFRGTRIQSILNEFQKKERIDVIQWSTDSNVLISRSLAPARVKEVVNIDEHTALAIIPDEDYSKAIGKGGVNIDLVSDFVGRHVDLKKASEFETEKQEAVLATISVKSIPDIDETLKKQLIDRGYTSVLSILKAPVEELRFLLGKDEAEVKELLEKIVNVKA